MMKAEDAMGERRVTTAVRNNPKRSRTTPRLIDKVKQPQHHSLMSFLLHLLTTKYVKLLCQNYERYSKRIVMQFIR